MTAAMVGAPFGIGGSSFFDGRPGRQLVKCPDCGQNADALFGDHGSTCLDTVKYPAPNSALGILRAYALTHERLSINDLRERFIAAGIGKNARGQALIAAQKRSWIELDGSVNSTSPGTKRSRVQTYRSLIVGEQIKKDDRS